VGILEESKKEKVKRQKAEGSKLKAEGTLRKKSHTDDDFIE